MIKKYQGYIGSLTHSLTSKLYWSASLTAITFFNLVDVGSYQSSMGLHKSQY